MDKKKSIANILSKYDKDTQKIYGHIATIERDTRHKIKRQEVRENIKAIIEKVVWNEVKLIDYKQFL